MLISVVICSRNRANQLDRVLESAAKMDVPADLTWELLLVDNGSTDQTRDVVQSYSDRLPIRYIFEGTPGLSNARNKGVAEAKGEYICWTDDDVLIDRGYLSAYAAAFKRHPDAAFFGGRIEPVLLGTTPKWFRDNIATLSTVIAERNLGPDQIVLGNEDDRLPFGANFSVRTKEQRENLYDPNLGVAPNQRRLGEETAVIQAIVGRGGFGIWVPDAIVQHIIPESRQTLRYIKVYQQSIGETWAYLSQPGMKNMMGVSVARGGNRVLGVPRWVVREALAELMLFAFYRCIGSSSKWLVHWQKYGYFKGAIDYWMRNHRVSKEAH